MQNIQVESTTSQLNPEEAIIIHRTVLRAVVKALDLQDPRWEHLVHALHASENDPGALNEFNVLYLELPAKSLQEAARAALNAHAPETSYDEHQLGYIVTLLASVAAAEDLLVLENWVKNTNVKNTGGKNTEGKNTEGLLGLKCLEALVEAYFRLKNQQAANLPENTDLQKINDLIIETFALWNSPSQELPELLLDQLARRIQTLAQHG